eukprot:NODE_6308_length_638_cov_17.115450_g5371_i0.p2 GENE.NODE_6308_length_638_cov_17.115450_g5371_i0~~NODE_6308_length_638_cov_17.115450_g5371_i0.p2  ORF type:complete len:124 (+),score=23.31 NODE_6308_length_638_cov_17.115450_g5371_i0:227-598(+)
MLLRPDADEGEIIRGVQVTDHMPCFAGEGGDELRISVGLVGVFHGGLDAHSCKRMIQDPARNLGSKNKSSTVGIDNDNAQHALLGVDAVEGIFDLRHGVEEEESEGEKKEKKGWDEEKDKLRH